MEDELERTRAVVGSLRELLERPVRLYDVSIRHHDAVEVVVRREPVAATEIEEWSRTTFAELEAAIVGMGCEIAGPTGSLFSQAFFEQGVGEVAAFAPVGPARRDRATHVGDGLRFEVLPAAYYAVAIHAGPYHDLDRTYGALGAHVAEHLITTDNPIREHYLVGPGDVSEATELRTELLWPIDVGSTSQFSD